MPETERNADPHPAELSPEERLLRVLFGNREPSPRVAAADREIDSDVLVAMDLISDSIERRGGYWSSVLDGVAADLDAMQPMERETAPSTA